MPRLDAERVALWRRFCAVANELQRTVDASMVAEQGVPLVWFDALSALREAGGSMRFRDLCAALGDVPSSVSRRLDRLVEDGMIIRTSGDRHDGRAVLIELTPYGRQVWRDANVAFRRVVQDCFAQRLTETDVAALQRVLSKAAT